MNYQQCALVVKEDLAWSLKHAPEATDDERAMFARGAVFGFRAGEATYRNWPTPSTPSIPWSDKSAFRWVTSVEFNQVEHDESSTPSPTPGAETT